MTSGDEDQKTDARPDMTDIADKCPGCLGCPLCFFVMLRKLEQADLGLERQEQALTL